MVSSYLRFYISHTNSNLTTHNSYQRQILKASAGFEPTISAGEQPQTHALDSAATGIANDFTYINQIENAEQHLNS